MARIVIAWELGEAFGHLARCLRLAEALCRAGHVVALALKEVRLPTAGPVTPGITLLQAPLTPQRSISGRHRPVNYADLLGHCGFAEAEPLHARLLAWQGIFSQVRAELLIADHAPTALLAAHLAGILQLNLSNGFAIPPNVRPWPSIRPWEEIDEQSLITAEQRLDRVTGAAQRMLGKMAPAPMRELFGAPPILDTFAELDHYQTRDNGCHVGPIVSIPQARQVSWQSRDGSRVVVYLRPEVPGFIAMLHALAHLDAEVFCVAPGCPPVMARRLATRRLRIALLPVDLSLLLGEADLAVGYGGSGFVTQALLAGVPLLLRPKYVEQMLLAKRIEAMGVGRQLEAGSDEAAILTVLQTMLGSLAHQRASRSFSRRNRQLHPEQAIAQARLLIEQRLAGHAQRYVAKPV